MTATRGKFVWPPKSAEVAPSARGDDGAGAGGAVVGGSAPVRSPRSIDIRPTTAGRSVISEIERVWLERSRAPLVERIRDAGWAVDPRERYCPRCASSAGPFAADDTGCGWCRGGELPWERAVRLGDYAGLLREMVLEVKFTRWRRLGDQLGRMLGERLAEELDLAGADRTRAALVPVPMSFRRWLLTGIDHSLVICRGVAAVTGLPIVRALVRRHRASQREVPLSQRVANVAGVFTPRLGVPVPWTKQEREWVVVVVDDVRTTGATMTAACRALRKAGGSATEREGEAKARLWSGVLGVTPIGPKSRRE